MLAETAESNMPTNETKDPIMTRQRMYSGGGARPAQHHLAMQSIMVEMNEDDDDDMDMDSPDAKILEAHHLADVEDNKLADTMLRRLNRWLRNTETEVEERYCDGHRSRDVLREALQYATSYEVDKMIASRVNDLDLTMYEGLDGVRREGEIDYPDVDAVDSSVVRTQKLIMSMIASGLMQAVGMYIVYYLCIAMVHAILYWSIPALEDFIRTTDWNDSFAIVYFMISLMLTTKLNANNSAYNKVPEQASTMLIELESLHTDMAGYLLSQVHTRCDCCEHTTLRTRVGAEKDYASTTKCLHRTYVLGIGALLDIYALIKLVIPMHRAAADSHTKDMNLQYFFLAKLQHLTSKIARMQREGMLNGPELAALQDHVKEIRVPLAALRFSSRYITPGIISNSMSMITNLYVWIILPMQGFSLVGYYMIPIYGFLALVIKMVDIVADQLGSAFDIHRHRVQPNKFEDWTKEHVQTLTEEIVRFDCIFLDAVRERQKTKGGM
jgi:hypothetical protein